MDRLNKEDLIKINGGLSLTGTVMNSFIRGMSLILGMGRSLGTVIRRLNENNVCEL